MQLFEIRPGSWKIAVDVLGGEHEGEFPRFVVVQSYVYMSFLFGQLGWSGEQQEKEP